jgi:hypothetical protein
MLMLLLCRNLRALTNIPILLSCCVFLPSGFIWLVLMDAGSPVLKLVRRKVLDCVFLV